MYVQKIRLLANRLERVLPDFEGGALYPLSPTVGTGPSVVASDRLGLQCDAPQAAKESISGSTGKIC
jgi:hypothetical protein